MVDRRTRFMMARKRIRGIRGAGSITELPGGQWRFRVTIGGRQVDYWYYRTEELAGVAQARWRLAHLLPAEDPEYLIELHVGLGLDREQIGQRRQM
jgi:hypothetical protein